MDVNDRRNAGQIERTVMATRTTIILAVAPLVAMAVGGVLISATREPKGAKAPVASVESAESTTAPTAHSVAAANAPP